MVEMVPFGIGFKISFKHHAYHIDNERVQITLSRLWQIYGNLLQYRYGEVSRLNYFYYAHNMPNDRLH